MFVDRPLDRSAIAGGLTRSPVVLLVGPRQVGKTSLAREFVAADDPNYFDLEDPQDLSRLNDPRLALSGLGDIVVIDEAQRQPELFPVLRVLADRDPLRCHFLVLGSASPDLLGFASDTLAGRVEVRHLGGFRVTDIGPESLDQLWLRGGFPRSFTASSASESARWRAQFIATFLERDLAQLGSRVPAVTMRRFWTMIAHYHGQTWNGSELARALGVSQPTVRRYLDALDDALVVRQVLPWFSNVLKRQVRAPKIYIRDSGLLHTLLSIASWRELLRHPKVGASWEGFVIEQLSAIFVDRPLYYWATHNGAELDLLVEIGGSRIGFEIKRTSSPSITPSMRSALQDLDLERLYVVHPGIHTFPLADRIMAIGVVELLSGDETALGR